MKTMILAAGYGKRLLPVTKEIPKPLLKVSNKTLIQRNIEILIDSGFDEIVINISYLGSMIIEHVRKCFPLVNIKFSQEEIPLGTGGGVIPEYFCRAHRAVPASFCRGHRCQP